MPSQAGRVLGGRHEGSQIREPWALSAKWGPWQQQVEAGSSYREAIPGMSGSPHNVPALNSVNTWEETEAASSWAVKYYLLGNYGHSMFFKLFDE